jgi:hypothetical protein
MAVFEIVLAVMSLLQGTVTVDVFSGWIVVSGAQGQPAGSTSESNP